ncbi:hypothetical protein BASA83_011177 [Batrachochytrium salamandrivorans]|nr:hypothetical protein BASA83_011177 [Batrachochytrium salamandrivorans]
MRLDGSWPSRSRDDESAVSAFFTIMMTYGAPFEIISDRGKSFLAEGIDLFERENKIRHLATTLTIHRLMGCTSDSNTRCDWILPFFLLFGIHPRLQLTRHLPKHFGAFDEIERMEETPNSLLGTWRKWVKQDRCNVRTKAQSEACETWWFDENTPDYFFKVGDMVKMKHHERSSLNSDGKVTRDRKPSPSTRNSPPISLREPKAALPNKFDGSRRHFRGFINQMETGLSTSRSTFMIPIERKLQPSVLSSRIRLFHGTTRTSSSLSGTAYDLSSWSAFKARMKATFGEINKSKSLRPSFDFERRQEQQYNPRPFRRNQPPTQPIPRIHSQKYQQQYVDNSHRQQIQQPSTSITATPVQQRPTSNDMDIDFARRGPLTSSERQQRFSQGLCLVCGQSGHLKATCPKSNPRFRSQRQVQAIAMEDPNIEVSGNDLGRL